MRPARLALADGTTFDGQSPDWQQPAAGEVVFNTGMTGYTETLTDPSYAGQILIFTYPLIGNYGIDLRTTESDRCHLSGVVVSQAASNWSHSQSDRSLLQWLREQKVPIITGVDTRAATRHLRSRGTMPGAILPEPQTHPERSRGASTSSGHAQAVVPELVEGPRFVGVDRPVVYNETGRRTVILVDCGAKENIVRSLVAQGLRVKRVPHDYDYTAEDHAGVLLSNGPGDPTDYQAAIAVTRRALAGGKPVFGICLGSQIMGLAAGARTYKLRFGHRGHNQPAVETGTDRCVITSQNHGYAVAAESLPEGWEVSFRNLNDGSVEGLRHRTKPFWSVQFHPEASPGPTDTAGMFKQFAQAL